MGPGRGASGGTAALLQQGPASLVQVQQQTNIKQLLKMRNYLSYGRCEPADPASKLNEQHLV